VPYARNRAFTGRATILSALEAAMKAHRATAPTQAITGLGGIGKTQTAVEYCYRHRNDYRAVLWARADSAESLHASFGEIATLLGLPEREAADRDVILEAVKRWLAREPGYLLVLDNADNPEVLPPFLPPDPHGHLLITSRAENLDHLNLDDVISLPEMPADEAVTFLFKRARSRDDDPKEHAAAEQLAAEMSYLPLALEQAAAYIAVNKSSFRDYLRDYQRIQLDLLEEQDPVADGYRETVRKTWTKNIRGVREVSPAAAELLAISAFLGPDRIPYEILIRGASELGESLFAALAEAQEDGRALNRLLTPLGRYSLIRRDRTSRAYDIHRLVQAVIRDAMDGEEQRLWSERAVRAVDRAFPVVDFSNWLACDRLLPHALSCADLIRRGGMAFPEAGFLLSKAGHYLFKRARYSEAEPLLLHALGIRMQRLGLEHPDTLKSLIGLARLYYVIGQYAKAEPLLLSALPHCRKVLGRGHPDTARCFNTLGSLLHAWGKLSEAEMLHREALAIRREVRGEDHPETARTLKDLGSLYRDWGKYSDAEPLLLRALQISRSKDGPKHPFTARCLHSLGSLYSHRGELAEAEEHFRCALAIREEVLGPMGHPDTAMTLISLANLLRDQNKLDEAEPLYRRGLAIYEKTLREGHPFVAKCLNGQARLLHYRREHDDAESLYRRALAIEEAALGPEHPYSANILSNLADLYTSQGRYAEAEPLYRRALGIRERVLGPTHPDVARVLDNLAELLVAESARMLGDGHVAVFQNNLAALLEGTKREGEAEVLRMRARAIRNRPPQ
jgi:tetratricopeptide (TPR) repeat protein